MTDVNFPAGSGKYLCVCPEGKRGDLCDQDVDECATGPCSSGRCINTGWGYRCECPAGLRGEEDGNATTANEHNKLSVCVCVFGRTHVSGGHQRV